MQLVRKLPQSLREVQMANRAGLKKVTKTVRGKKGTVKRSYWVKAKGAVKGWANRHPMAAQLGKKALVAGAIMGTAALLHKYKSGVLRNSAVQAGGRIGAAYMGAKDRVKEAGHSLRRRLKIPHVYIKNGKTVIDRDYNRSHRFDDHRD